MVSAFYLEPDLIIASLILVFVMSQVMDYTLSLFNQRKVAFIISNFANNIAEDILTDLKQSATLLNGTGAYTQNPQNIVMTVVNNIQLKKLEEITFTNDPNALFIVENTFNVLGSSFSKRKQY